MHNYKHLLHFLKDNERDVFLRSSKDHPDFLRHLVGKNVKKNIESLKRNITK